MGTEMRMAQISFLSLPVELRDMVYDHIFQARSKDKPIFKTDKKEPRCVKLVYDASDSYMLLCGSTNMQISNEIKRMFFKRFLFSIPASIPGLFWCKVQRPDYEYEDPLRYLSPNPDKINLRPFVSRLELGVDYVTAVDEQLLSHRLALLGLYPALSELTIKCTQLSILETSLWSQSEVLFLLRSLRRATASISEKLGDKCCYKVNFRCAVPDDPDHKDKFFLYRPVRDLDTLIETLCSYPKFEKLCTVEDRIVLYARDVSGEVIDWATPESDVDYSPCIRHIQDKTVDDSMVIHPWGPQPKGCFVIEE